MQEIKFKFSTSPPSWLIKFLEVGGLENIFACLSVVENKRNFDFEVLLKEAQMCSLIRILLNNQPVLHYILHHLPHVFKQLVDLVLNSKNGLMKSQMLILLAGLAIYNKKCLKLVQESVKFVSKNPRPYFALIKLLKEERDTPLMTACMSLINAIIAGEKELGTRNKLRMLFVDGEIITIMEKLRQKFKTERTLLIQFIAFDQMQKYDQEQLQVLRYVGKMDLQNAGSIFDKITQEASRLGISPLFISILQHLLLIPEISENPKATLSFLERFSRRVVYKDEVKSVSELTLEELRSHVVQLLETSSQNSGFSAPPPPSSAPSSAPAAPQMGKSEDTKTPQEQDEDAEAETVPPPRAELRHFYWKKLPDNKVPEFWTEVKTDLARIEPVFGMLEEKFFASKSSAIAAPKPEVTGPQKVTLLPVQIANNISIIRNQFKNFSDMEILTALLEVKRNTFNEFQLQSLLKCIPSDEVVDALLQYDGDMEDLREAERFALTLLTVDNITEKLETLIFINQFSTRVENIKMQLVHLKSACESVLINEKLQSVLSVLLATGNVLNYGGQHGKSRSIQQQTQLHPLTKLAQMRAAKNSNYSLSDFLVELIEEEYKELYPQHLQTIVDIEYSCRFQPELIRSELKDIREGLNKILHQVQTTPDEEKQGMNSQYFEFIDEFLKSNIKVQQDTEEEYSHFLEFSKKVLEAFGNTSADSLQDLIGQLYLFSRKFKEIVLEHNDIENDFVRYHDLGWINEEDEDEKQVEAEQTSTQPPEQPTKKVPGILDQAIGSVMQGQYDIFMFQSAKKTKKKKVEEKKPEEEKNDSSTTEVKKEDEDSNVEASTTTTTTTPSTIEENAQVDSNGEKNLDGDDKELNISSKNEPESSDEPEDKKQDNNDGGDGDGDGDDTKVSSTQGGGESEDNKVEEPTKETSRNSKSLVLSIDDEIENAITGDDGNNDHHPDDDDDDRDANSFDPGADTLFDDIDNGEYFMLHKDLQPSYEGIDVEDESTFNDIQQEINLQFDVDKLFDDAGLSTYDEESYKGMSIDDLLSTI
eukprot:TRINITY_DN2576_c0_g1_i2.p1 TRINITY_DN2576_c0_g1~~TRINITY_DN2576_c0_g1_i2.p1  ORF type:complete len:1043 (+),score=353.83 TRINITY_DN2576_c0_g1_i2:1447-4575(+)